MDKCPSCNRVFQDINDFPLVKVLDVSIIKPSDVPEKIPHWYRNFSLLGDALEEFNRELVPRDVLAYFNDNPAVGELVHSDGYIYNISLEPQESYAELSPENELDLLKPASWSKTYNHAPAVKAMLESNEYVKSYLTGLSELVGREVPTERISPLWDKDDYFHQFIVPNSGNPPYGLKINDGGKPARGERLAELILLGAGPNLGSACGPTLVDVLKLGSIRYVGETYRSPGLIVFVGRPQ